MNEINEVDEIRVQKLSHAIADRLRAQIVSGQRKPGDRLPPESELLEQFKVSRPTVREALRILEVESLIVLGRGARTGATVQEPSVERASQYAAMVLVRGGATMGELHEVRTLLEPPIVNHLASHGDDSIIERLQARLEDAKTFLAGARFEEAIEAFNGFHADLVAGSANRALNLIVEMLRILSMGTSEALLGRDGPDSAELVENLTKTISAYEKLLEKVRQGKADEAETLWRKYMLVASTILERSGLGAKKLAFYPPR